MEFSDTGDRAFMRGACSTASTVPKGAIEAGECLVDRTTCMYATQMKSKEVRRLYVL